MEYADYLSGFHTSGDKKAVRNGTAFDTWSSTLIIIGYAIPSFLFAILLVVLFSGGSYFDLFPLRGLVSSNWDTLPWYSKITDYLWHITLPVLATVIGGFATLTMLTKTHSLMKYVSNMSLRPAPRDYQRKNSLSPCLS